MTMGATMVSEGYEIEGKQEEEMKGEEASTEGMVSRQESRYSHSGCFGYDSGRK